MKFVNKLSVISLIVLMFSFMNVANAYNSGDCMTDAVKACGDSKTSGTCASTFAAGNPAYTCSWDSSTSTCKATKSTCYGPKCVVGNECKSSYSCSTYRSAAGLSVCRATSNNGGYINDGAGGY